MVDSNLTVEEIICLQWAGLSSREIMQMSLKTFNRLYDERDDEVEDLLDKATTT